MLEALIGAGGKVADMLFGVQNRRAGEDFARYQMAENIRAQREFAQNAVQWKVEDAKKAGVHPLYAIGAQTQSFSPISVSSPDAGKTDFGSMGQDLSRAMNANRTGSERMNIHQEAMNKLVLEGKSLENDLLRQKLRASIAAGTGPALPDVVPEAEKYEDRPRLKAGANWNTDDRFVNAEDAEKRYGDLIQELYGVGVLAADAWKNAYPWVKGGADYVGKRWPADRGGLSEESRSKLNRYYRFLRR